MSKTAEQKTLTLKVYSKASEMMTNLNCSFVYEIGLETPYKTDVCSKAIYEMVRDDIDTPCALEIQGDQLVEQFILPHQLSKFVSTQYLDSLS